MSWRLHYAAPAGLDLSLSVCANAPVTNLALWSCWEVGLADSQAPCTCVLQRYFRDKHLLT